jgi:glycosyltransferase involved in cell wall biosynthesis
MGKIMKDRYLSDPLISVIIPSRNSMSGNERIDRLLSSIIEQTYKNFEIIVVDNSSSDGVEEICTKFPVRFFQSNTSISEARNLGIEKAMGEFFIFLDCDQVIPPKLFEECISLVRLEDVDCIVIEIECVSSELQESKCVIDCSVMHEIEVRAGIGTTGTVLPLFYSSCVVSSEKFPQKVQLGEDFLFASRIIKKNPRVAKAKLLILHYEDPTLKGVLFRSLDYGRAYITLQTHSPADALVFLSKISVFGFGVIRRLLFALASKPRAILPFGLYILTKYMAFATGYVSARLLSK